MRTLVRVLEHLEDGFTLEEEKMSLYARLAELPVLRMGSVEVHGADPYKAHYRRARMKHDARNPYGPGCQNSDMTSIERS